MNDNNNKIKSLINIKPEYFKNCVKQNNPDSIKHFEQMQDALPKNIEISKPMHYSKLSKKLSANNINPKCYWLILK